MAEKTHWKKIVSDPNFIGEADFEEGEEKVLTISRVNATEKVTTAEGTTQKAVVHFQERGNKPMILNVARSKNIEKVCGSPYFEDWIGVKIQLYIEKGIRAFGETVNAVRVRPFKPRVKVAPSIPPCSDCKKPISGAFNHDAAWVVGYTKNHYGLPLCADCAAKRKEQKPETPQEEAEKTES